MSNLVTRAQIVLLARTLHVPPERLAHLERLAAAHLHELQERMSAVIFEHHAESFKRVSRLVPFIPMSIGVPIMKRIVPSAMIGRASGLIGVDHPKKIPEIVELLGTSLAADCQPYMDPRTISHFAEATYAPFIRIINEVLRRRDYIAVGPILDYAAPQLLGSIEQGVRDDAGLIYSAAYVYPPESVSAFLRQLLTGPVKRFPRMARVVLAGPPDLQLAALSVFARCEPEIIRTIGEILFTVGSPPALGNLIGTAIRVGAVPELLTLTGSLSRHTLGRMAANPIFDDPAVMASIIGALNGRTDPNYWRGLFALAARTTPTVQRHTARLLAGLPDAMVVDLPTRATEADVWPMLLQIVANADPAVQGRFGAAWAMLSAERRAGLQWHIHENHLDARLTAITEAAPTISVEEVFFKRRQHRRHLGTADTGSSDNWSAW
jgi:hypothetical protein